MKAIIGFIKSEPAILLSLLGSAIALATSFGLKLSASQTHAVYGMAAALTGVLIRQVVTPQP